jgi:hypothetical protein
MDPHKLVFVLGTYLFPEILAVDNAVSPSLIPVSDQYYAE